MSTEPDETQVDDSADDQPEPAWVRRRRLAAVFGDVLPEATSDDRDVESGSGSAATEDWLKSQVPPHHG